MERNDIMSQIKEKLNEIERKENVTVLFAVESGSRAWGFASDDSDHDVRFVYRRNDINDYLRLDGIRDVIEYELNDVYDISGWDLDKTLKLLHSSNPVIFEWLSSKIVYKETGFLDEFREFAKSYFRVIKGAHHYLHMAEKNYEEHLKTDEVKLKKYFYVLRSLLAVRYILEYHESPPILFKDLVETELDESLKETVYELIDIKKNSTEPDTIRRIEVLDEYIVKELGSLKKEVNGLKKEETDWEGLNRFFIETIRL